MLEVVAHHFSDHLYCKELIIKKGFRAKQHVHKYDHLSVLAKGSAIVTVDDEDRVYHAPAVINIEAGKQHSVTALNDVVWLCIHSTNCTDVDQIDEVLIEPVLHMNRMDKTVDVSLLNKQIDAHPELWNRYTLRTQLYEDSPHREVDDIFLRYRDFSEFDEDDPEAFAGPHESVWYAASFYLPAVGSIVRDILPGGSELGGVLITRIPPGKQVYPHNDAGHWHSEYYRDKYLVLLESAPGQQFCFENEIHEGRAGEVFKFNNLVPHWVVNDSDTNRVSLIIAAREAS